MIITVIISGLVGFARLKLKAHNQAQVYTGFLTGAFIMLLFFLIN
jgi:membrane-associated phospholipid phosphatase